MRLPGRCGMLASGRNEVSSLQLPLEEPLSPELVLVCPPELAERARRLLPDPGWRAPVVRSNSPPRASRLQALMLVLFCLLTTVMPLILTALAIGSHSGRR